MPSFNINNLLANKASICYSVNSAIFLRYITFDIGVSKYIFYVIDAFIPFLLCI